MNDAPAVPAPLTRRVLARFVDVLVLVGISLLVNAAVISLAPGDTPLAPASFSAVSVTVAALTFAAYLGYEVVLTRVYGATPGKRLCGLGVVAASGGKGEPVTVQDGVRPAGAGLLVRASVLYASVLFTPVPVLGVVALGLSVYAVVSAILDRPAGRGLHDRWGGSLVVSERARSVSS